MGEDNSEEKPIELLARYMNELEEAVKDLQGKTLVYRGHADGKEWELKSAAFRRLEISDNPPTMPDYLNGLIEDVKLNGWHWVGSREYKELEILALLQHNGAATCLMDWSRSFHIALWFACEKEKDKDGKEVDGKVFITDIEDINYTQIQQKNFKEPLSKIFENLEKSEKSEESEKSEKLESSSSEIGGKKKYFYWEAENLNDRISRQESVFIFGHEPINLPILKYIEVKGGDKADLRKMLKLLLNITSEGLFKDLVGFANNNRYNQPIESIDYLSRGNDYFQKGEYDKAIDAYTSAIRQKPDYVEAYNNRGLAWHKKGEYDKAISDYSEAIRLKPDHVTAYLGRGLARASKDDYASAIADYNEVIQLKPDHATAYLSRGAAWAAWVAKGEKKKAIADLKIAKELFGQQGNAEGVETARQELEIAEKLGG